MIGGNGEETVLKANELGLFYKPTIFASKRHYALKGVSFDIKRGETFGIIGRNGCGKSTLLKILAGVLAPDQGALTLKGISSRSLLSLGLGFDDSLTGRDNAILSLMLQGHQKRKSNTLLEKIQEFSDLGEFFDLPVRSYSSGMRSRLGFSVAIESKCDLFLVDETLSVGDAQFRVKAEAAMINRMAGDQTVVFVSHDARQMNLLCDRCMWLEAGEVQEVGRSENVTAKYLEHLAN